MFTLRGLFALTFVIAIVCGLWVMGSQDQIGNAESKSVIAIVIFLLSSVGFVCILNWIRDTEQANSGKSAQARRWFSLVSDSIAFLCTCSLMAVVCRVLVNMLLQ